MNKKNVILALAVASLALLSGCKDDEERAALFAKPQTQDVGEFMNCHVYFVNRGYEANSFYMAMCPGQSVAMTQNHYETQGKSQVFRRSAQITQEITKLEQEKASAEAREKAMEKLSPEERKALGL